MNAENVVTPRPEETSDLPVRCANLVCGRWYPQYAMPSSGLCPNCEERRVQRERERWLDRKLVIVWHGVEIQEVQHAGQ